MVDIDYCKLLCSLVVNDPSPTLKGRFMTTDRKDLKAQVVSGEIVHDISVL